MSCKYNVLKIHDFELGGTPQLHEHPASGTGFVPVGVLFHLVIRYTCMLLLDRVKINDMLPCGQDPNHFVASVLQLKSGLDASGRAVLEGLMFRY